MIKRLFDLLASGMGLLVLSPLFLIIAICIKLDSVGLVYFRQERVGRFGRTFRIHKFRTMTDGAEFKGPQITVKQDRRITQVGKWLRAKKLDELPQLIDVFIGHMSLVGPRPEVPKYINYYPVDVRDKVLSVRPGITDWASISFKDENDILGKANDPENTYIQTILPIKQQIYLDYVKSRSFLGDLRIILATIFVVLRRRD